MRLFDFLLADLFVVILGLNAGVYLHGTAVGSPLVWGLVVRCFCWDSVVWVPQVMSFDVSLVGFGLFWVVIWLCV